VFTSTVTGFKNGETLGTSGVTGSPSLTTTATAASSVAGRPYPITAVLGTLAAGNYDFSFVAGNLTITKAHLTVTADSASRPYGDPNPAFTATFAGSNGETLTVTKTAGTHNSTTVAGANTVTTSLGSGDFAPGVGTLLANWCCRRRRADRAHHGRNADGGDYQQPDQAV
jgi:hypothetical protein